MLNSFDGFGIETANIKWTRTNHSSHQVSSQVTSLTSPIPSGVLGHWFFVKSSCKSSKQCLKSTWIQVSIIWDLISVMMRADKVDPNAEERQAGSQHTRNWQAQKNMREWGEERGNEWKNTRNSEGAVGWKNTSNSAWLTKEMQRRCGGKADWGGTQGTGLD